MTTNSKRPEAEQKKEQKPTESPSAVELMRKMLAERGSTAIKVTPPKGWCQVIFKR